MPNRILKESICTSESIDGLDWFQEVLFYRLIVNCDDYGRFDGRTAVIKSRCFGLKGRLTLKRLEDALAALEGRGLIRRYTAQGRPYLLLPGWNAHQTIRAKRSKYPEPESNGSQPLSSASGCPRHPIQSHSESGSVSQSEGRAGEFEAFWNAYPRKVGKGKAMAAFARAEVSLDTLLEAVARQKTSAQWSRDGGRFIPHPTTWLERRGWEDELAPVVTEHRGARGELGQAELEAIARVMGEGQ